MRRWLLGSLGLVIGGAIVAVVTFAVALFPWVRDDVVLDGVVQAVALDWRDFGKEAAITRLQYELDHHAIGMQVGDDDCILEADADGNRHVRCEWAVAIRGFSGEDAVPLHFRSHATIATDGDLQ